jgi:hypothetical protein
MEQSQAEERIENKIASIALKTKKYQKNYGKSRRKQR